MLASFELVIVDGVDNPTAAQIAAKQKAMRKAKKGGAK
jgi:hypothetical protein